MRFCDAIAAIPRIARYFLREVSAPPKWYDTPHLGTLFHTGTSVRYPHFATYCAIIVRYPPQKKTSTKQFCDTLATSIARYEKYCCWTSKLGGFCMSALLRSPESRGPTSETGRIWFRRARFQTLFSVTFLAPTEFRDRAQCVVISLSFVCQWTKHPQYCWKFHDQLREAPSGTISDKRGVPQPY